MDASNGISVARGLVDELAAELLAEQEALPLSIFGTPVPRHYTIGAIRDVLATLDNRLADLERQFHERATDPAEKRFQGKGRRGVASVSAGRQRPKARARRRQKQA